MTRHNKGGAFGTVGLGGNKWFNNKKAKQHKAAKASRKARRKQRGKGQVLMITVMGIALVLLSLYAGYHRSRRLCRIAQDQAEQMSSDNPSWHMAEREKWMAQIMQYCRREDQR